MANFSWKEELTEAEFIEAFGENPIDEYQRLIHDYFEEKGYDVEGKKFIKHITMGKSASLIKEAKKNLFFSFKNLKIAVRTLK